MAYPTVTRIAPDAARTMAEVRAAVDAIDSALVGLLAERMRFMDAAARIKQARSEVRDEVRKAAVIAHVRQCARAHGLDPDLVARLWEELVEASIAHEFAAWDRLHGGADQGAAGEGDPGASDGARTRDLRRDRPAL